MGVIMNNDSNVVAEGIESTKCAVVFITKRYQEKVITMEIVEIFVM
jgi:hypothetical protein